jgi:hypothetical protein
MLHHTDRSCMSATGVVSAVAARPSTPDSCIDSLTLHIYAVVPSAWCYRPYQCHCTHPLILLSTATPVGLSVAAQRSSGTRLAACAAGVPGSSECEVAPPPHPSMLGDYIASQA